MLPLHAYYSVYGKKLQSSPLVISFGVGHHRLAATAGGVRLRLADRIAGKVKQTVCTAFLP
jgi:hypothetical protein